MITSFINLQDKERHDIQRMYQDTKRTVIKIRCRVVLLRDAHIKSAVVAETVNKSDSYVNQVCRYYNRYGIAYLRGDKDFRKQKKVGV